MDVVLDSCTIYRLLLNFAVDNSEVQKCTMSPFVEIRRIWEMKEGYLLINMSLVALMLYPNTLLSRVM